MASFTKLLSSFETNTNQYNAFLQDLLTLGNDIPFKTDEVNVVTDAIISTINSRLNQANIRYNGLVLLDAYLPMCSKETLSKHGMLWIAKATQVVESADSNSQYFTIACKVIGNLITRCKVIPELQKQISMQNVKQLVNVLSNLDNATNYGATYYLLATLLYHYPEVCERFQTLIKKMVLFQVDASNATLATAGAKCFALLVRATERTFKPPSTKLFYTCWTYNEALICNSLHDIIDSLFSNLVEIESADIWEKLELSHISEEDILQYYSQQQQRFSNLCLYLSVMLRGCEEKNSVLPDDVLQLLCRGLAIRPINLKRQNSFKEQILYLMLPKLHISLLNVLTALIDGFKQELIPFGSTILQLFNQMLKWTGSVMVDQITISNSKPFKNIRVSVYKCLSLWLVCNNSLSGVETIMEECLPYILEDIIPERDRVQLTVKNTQNLSKKAVKRFKDSQYEKSSALNNTVSKNPSLDANLCKEALITVQNILFSSSIYLKQTFYKNLQNIVIPLLNEYYLGSPVQNFYKEKAECRLQLLRVLRNLQLNPHASSAPSTQYAIKIFEMAFNDPNLNIVQEAQYALSELEKIVHPAAPTLCLPRIEEISNEYDEICITETAEKSVEQENSSQEEFEPPSNKRPKKVNILTSVTEKVHFNITAPVTDKVTKRSEINVELSESEERVVNEEESVVKSNESKTHDSLQEDQVSDKTEDKQLEQMETTSTELNDKLKENNNFQTLREKNVETDVKMDDDEEKMLKLFFDVPKDNN